MLRRLFSSPVKIRSDKVTNYLQTLHSTTVPPMRGSLPVNSGISSHKDFLKIIGRNTVQHADKFKDWEDFYLSSPKKLKILGIKAPESRYISSWKEWYKRGRKLVAIPIPKRKLKHLKSKKKAEDIRRKKLGLL